MVALLRYSQILGIISLEEALPALGSSEGGALTLG